MMPKHQVYIEAFLGGGAVMRMKKPAELNIGIDLDSAVIDHWRTAGDVARPSGASGKDGRRRRPTSQDPAAAIEGASSRFWFHHGDALAFLGGYPFTGAELVYCDPPYVRSTCTSRCRYKHDLSDVDHRRLLRRLLEIPCPVIISGYHSEMYAAVLKGWRSSSFQAMSRRGPRTQWLWSNFPPPTELHDDRYIGENRRQREYLKRQKARWAARLQTMPPLKRRALFAAIASVAENEDPRGPSVLTASAAD